MDPDHYERTQAERIRQFRCLFLDPHGHVKGQILTKLLTRDDVSDVYHDDANLWVKRCSNSLDHSLVASLLDISFDTSVKFVRLYRRIG